MTIADIHHCLHTLSQKRPFFVSEADFQHCFALELENYGFSVFLEFPITHVGTKKVSYIDLVVWDNDGKTCHPIEFKYKTKAVQCYGLPIHNPFPLKTHSATDINRYLFWKDVFRIEQIMHPLHSNRGYVIFLTNDDNYWTPSGANTIDALFRLHSSMRVQSVYWQNTDLAPSYLAGTVLYPSFTLSRPYIVPQWIDYSKGFSQTKINSTFKSLTIEV